MGCILGTHGPYVHPSATSSPQVPLATSWSSPPDPLSTTGRGGTKGEFLVPPLPKGEGDRGGGLERGTGGEGLPKPERELHPQTAPPGRPRRPPLCRAP